MYYYVVPMVGVGTMDNPIHPDLPVEISWVGCDCNDGYYTLATAARLIGLSALTDAGLADRCKMAGLKLDEVQAWRVAQ